MGPHLVECGIVTKADTPFVTGCIDLMSNALEMVNDADRELLRLVTYPLAETVASGAADKIIEDNLKTVAEYVLAKYDDGSLQQVWSFFPMISVVPQACMRRYNRHGDALVCPRACARVSWRMSTRSPLI